MLFFRCTLIDHEVTVELKNDIQLKGTLKSVDQYLNIKLDDISVVEELKYPHLVSVKNVFIRGSVVRYVHLPAASVDTQLLEDATRRGRSSGSAGQGEVIGAVTTNHDTSIKEWPMAHHYSACGTVHLNNRGS
ncbi:small nuclear ribonucleoprotein LSM2 [Purpureocillium lilacinum]|uniref:Small nuclear ribonucleoprotein LSM2 n=1 Tax=Purpureocillium lilacinum TaxID=33203 RepID=A0A179H288_PURLI|nr:small nuclear ribonucleoprotein LSM2 [Purpureocillium lilacinum]